MKAVAFNGSPRQNGNTQKMLQKVLEPIAAEGIDTELVQVGGKQISGCTACMWCAENQKQRCVIDDDELNSYLQKMLAADAIILGSPSYFADMSSDLKALIDRAGYVAATNGGLLARKIGAAVAVHRRGGATHVFDSINHFFLMSRMIVPGSTYWNFGVGRMPGDVKSDTEGLKNMRDLGSTIAWLLPRLQD